MANTFIRKAMYGAITSTYSFATGLCKNRQGNCILMYHAIGTPIADDRNSLYTLPPALFEIHMQKLVSNHKDCLNVLSAGMFNPKQKNIAVTFDDGYADNLYVAKPILEKLKIPFTVFVIAGSVASRAQGFLTPEELRTLSQCPYAQVGSHGMTHKRLAECNDHDLMTELKDSKHYLEDLMGREINLLSYPHGSVDDRVADFARKAGYILGASSRFSSNREDFNLLRLSRTDIWADDSASVLEEKIAGNWDWLRWRS